MLILILILITTDTDEFRMEMSQLLYSNRRVETSVRVRTVFVATFVATTGTVDCGGRLLYLIE
jgi:hypothetical protein